MTYRMRNKKRRRYGKRTASVGFFAVLVVILVFILELFGAIFSKVFIEDTFAGTPDAPTWEKVEVQQQKETADPAAGEAKTIKSNITDTIEKKDPVFVLLPVNMPEEDQKIVFEIATEYNISYALVMAIIGHETEFTKNARSSTGDNGYMQINDCNVEEMARRGFTDLYDTRHNVSAGCSILADLFKAYGDDEVHKVLMAYNMGSYGASKLWDQGVTSSEYSREIVAREKEYSAYIDAQIMGE